jgi:6-pyruvoyltetrahydropterin/6-carboxytetrahydropterin synthase
MTVIRTSRKFEAAHRQLGDPSKCGKLHGHNWNVVVELRGTPNKIGYVVDFKDVHNVIDEFDHSIILCDKDPLVTVLQSVKQHVVVVPLNPTCENLAVIILRRIAKLDCKARHVKVTVYENDESYAIEESEV